MRRERSTYIYILALAVIGIAAIYWIRSSESMRTATRDGVAMDTFISMSLSSPRAARSDAELTAMLDDIFAMLGDLERQMSMQEPTSDLHRLNDGAAREPVAVSRDLFRAIESALDMADITDGAYDPTIGAITKIWRASDGFHVPTDDELERACALVGASNVELQDRDRIKFVKRGVAIDLGGIAKGYASARITEYLRANDIRSALINLGGNVIAHGGRPDGRPWRIGVQRPGGDRGDALCAIEVHSMSVITAGIYERTWNAAGETYTHIYDPNTGRPISGDLQSVTIVAEDPVAGDALSTAFMVLGEARAIDLMRILPAVDAVFVSRHGDGFDITATSGLKKSIELIDRRSSLTFVDAR